MERVTLIRALLSCCIAFFSRPVIASAKGKNSSDLKKELAPEEVDNSAVQAYRKFWQAFDDHESKMVNNEQESYQRAFRELRDRRLKDLHRLSQQEFERLEKSIETYREHLTTHSEALNVPYVAMNLANVLRIKVQRLREQDANAGVSELQEAMALLRNIEKEYPAFENLEEVYYLHALILTDIGDRQGALATWQRLAQRPGKTIYAVHGRIAVGDYLFQAEKASEALVYFQDALKILKDNPKWGDGSYERLRVEYRISWASYRAADLKAAIESGQRLLEPGRDGKLIDALQRIQQDAIELIGDALFEYNDPTYSRMILHKKSLAEFAPAIALRLMARFQAAQINSGIVETAEGIVKDYPAAKEIPDILTMAGAALQQTGEEGRKIAVLEQLALLLPSDSLWRSRYKDDFDAIRNMEKKAREAALSVAAYRYEYGMGSGSVSAFDAASMFYAMLLEYEPNGADSNIWRLKRAHAAYFSDKLKDADRMYSALKSDYAVDPPILEVAAYQLVLTRDKAFRQVYAVLEAKGLEAAKDPVAIERLRSLEQAIDDYVNRFPARNRAIDLLLVGASANRDAFDWAKAFSFWQRALVAGATPGQRSIAIRGIVMYKVELGDGADIIQTSANFLRLEDWQQLGSGLRNELYGILSRAITDESNRLNDQGESLAAGAMMVELSTEFPQIPSFDRIYRDGAYLIAIGGDWAGAERAARYYLDKGYKTTASDLSYLLARAQEFQMRFAVASLNYLKVAERYPNHNRAEQSAERAENLALAEGDLKTAARAAILLGDRARKEDKAIHYGRATGYYKELGEWAEVAKTAAKSKAVASSKEERLRAELDEAKADYQSGQELKALKAFDQLATKSQRGDGYENEMAADVYGESNFLLAEEAKRQFDDFVILEREGSPKNNIDQKAKYFESLILLYEKAITSAHPQWSSASRYYAGDAAQRFSDELNALTIRLSDLDNGELQKIRQSVTRLRALAKKYHGHNLIVSRKAPAQYRNNEWIRKSQIKLSGYMTNDGGDADPVEQAPIATGAELPYQWSL